MAFDEFKRQYNIEYDKYELLSAARSLSHHTGCTEPACVRMLIGDSLDEVPKTSRELTDKLYDLQDLLGFSPIKPSHDEMLSQLSRAIARALVAR